MTKKTLHLLLIIGIAGLLTACKQSPAPTPTPEPIAPDNAGWVQQLAILERGSINQLAWSPDGNSLAVAASVGVWLYDTAALDTSPRLLKGHTGSVWCVTFSPDGRTLASGSMDRTLRLWDVATGAERGVFQTDTGIMPAGAVLALVFSRDGSTLVSGSLDGKLQFWDVATGEESAVLEGSKGGVSHMVFSPDGGVVALGRAALAPAASGSVDDTVRLWDMATGTERAVLQANTGILPGGTMFPVAFSPDGQTVASGSGDGTVQLWDVVTGTERAVLPGHTGEVSAVTFSPDGAMLASGSRDANVRLWDLAIEVESAALHGHTGGVSAVTFSPDGAILASGGADGTIRLWGVPNGP